jgi:hypothetical protein
MHLQIWHCPKGVQPIWSLSELGFLLKILTYTNSPTFWLTWIALPLGPPPLASTGLIMSTYASFYWDPLALVISKCSINSLAFTMYLAATQLTTFLLCPHHFIKYSFCLRFLHLRLSSHVIFQMTSYKVVRLPNHLLAIRPLDVFYKCL